MNEIMPYIWIGIIVFAAVSEIYTFALVSVWFIPSALAAFILSLTGFHVWIQVFVFFIISFIFIVISSIFFRKLKKSANSNSFSGKSAIVTQEINNYKNTGAVRINGIEYAAKSEDDDIIYESGLVVTVIKIEITEQNGAKAICSR